MIKYKSVRDPILYLVDEYFKNKQMTKKNRDGQGTKATDTVGSRDNLPEYPVLFIQDDSSQYVRAIYGNYEYLGKDAEVDIRIWQEEFVYDAPGHYTQIVTTYPDGSTATLNIIRDANDSVTGIGS